jgi:pilus assembly protein Flp/PilA
MFRAVTRICRFLASEEGPTAVEYAVMTGFVIVIIASAVSALVPVVSAPFSSVSSTLS